VALRPHLRLIALIGSIVPRRLRADWRQEWETELCHRERLLADWDRLDWRNRLDLLRRSSSAFVDAVWLQKKRLEADVFQDLRYGVRMLWTHPGFATVAIVTLALGIGANTAIFTLLDKLLLRTLPVEQPNQLVAFVSDGKGEPGIFSYPGYVNLRDHNDVLSGLAASVQRPFSLSDGAQTERLTGEIVSGNYFEVLGVRPTAGRFFRPEEDRTPGVHAVVVIGHALWRRRFGADPAVLGRTIAVNAHPYAIVGVAPPGFKGIRPATESEIYLPAMMAAQLHWPSGARLLSNPNWGWLHLIGRLKPGVPRARAQAALAVLSEREQGTIGAKRPAAPRDALLLLDGSRGHTDRVRDLSQPLTLMMGVVGFVLLISCANVANLLLARASTRSREIAVRLAVGASRLRIVRQFLTESSLLAVLGGGVGLALAYGLLGLLQRFQQPASHVPRTLDGTFDGRTLGFTLVLSVVTGVAFSLAPALQASGRDLVSGLKEDAAGQSSGPRRVGVRNLLVVAQVALSLVVLIGAGLFVKSLRALQAVDPGFEASNVVTASFALDLNGYDRTRGRAFLTNVVERVSALPGVEAVSFGHIVAFSDSFWFGRVEIDGYQPQEGERMGFDFNVISPNYFATLGTPLVSGREFTLQDSEQASKVIVINEVMARRYWPGQEAVGKRTSRGEVVGVVRNTREKGVMADPRPTVYMPLEQSYVPQLTLHVRSATDPAATVAALRREVRALDPALPLYNVRTLADQRDGSLHTERVAAALLALFGAIALILAAVGLYGVLSYSVTARTREMGIRLAQGAQPRDLLTLVVGQGMRLTVVGLVVGVAAAFALTRLIEQLLFGVTATDPLTFAVVPLLLAGVALAACWIPARRATRMDPLAALRHE
jgi:predicted permease